jgi:nitrite reductase/ring-hydroxylating ferredoxin subunit
MATEHEVGPVEDLTPGTVVGAGPYVVGNSRGERFALSRRCRHLRADLARGSIDDEGCLVCPWHRSRYDVKTGRMVTGPQGWFAKVPGLDLAFESMTKVVPLKKGRLEERDGTLFVT